MKRLIALLVALLTTLAPALAADVGIYVRSGTSSITSPVASQTWVFDTSTNQLLQWSGTAWEQRLIPKLKLAGAVDPSATDDAAHGFAAGAIWVNSTSKQVFVCADPSTGVAVWYPITNRIAAADVLSKLSTADVASDFVVSGAIASTSANLTATTTAGVGYVSGLRVCPPARTFTYTASKDTYEYLQSDNSVVRVEVNNGDAAPSGQPGLALQKVVSSGSAITSVVRLAPLMPRLKAAAAQAGSEAVNLDQADARYATIGASTPGAANRVWASPDGSSGSLSLRALVNNDMPILSLAKGGTGNEALTAYNLGLYYGDGGKMVQMPTPAASQKIRSNASGTALEYAADTNGTVTGATFSLPSDAFNTSVTGTATQVISGTYKTNAIANRVIGSDASGAVSLMALVNSQMPVLDLAHGGSNNGLLAATQWTLPYLDGSKMVNTPVLGAGQSVRLNGAGNAMEAFTPAAAQNPFGGSGIDGAVSKGATTETSAIQINATTFTQTVSTTWQPQTNTVVNASSTITFNGTTTVGTGCSGGQAATVSGGGSSFGSGPSGGAGCTSFANTTSGGGGANAGAGGSQGGNNSGTYNTAANPYPFTRLGGSGGGGASYNATAAGAGGNGGGSFVACAAGGISIASGGSITANGQNGTSGGNGGGGGAGGTIYLASQTSISNSGTISANAGDGGNGTNRSAGAGGGGGYIIFHSPSNTNGTRSVNGGAAGTSTNATVAPTAGSAGVTLSITGTPNLPLLIALKNGGLNQLKALALTKKVLQPSLDKSFDVEITQREAAIAASANNVIKFAKIIDGTMQEATCIEIGDFEALGDAA